jgi:hypothetical protein
MARLIVVRRLANLSVEVVAFDRQLLDIVPIRGSGGDVREFEVRPKKTNLSDRETIVRIKVGSGDERELKVAFTETIN